MTRRLLPFVLPLLLLAGCQPGTSTAKGSRGGSNAATASGETPTDEGQKPATDEIALAAAGDRVPVIMYHDIVAQRAKSSVWFDCSADEFEAQMAKIQAEGMTPISMQALYEHLSTGATLPQKPIVLTFDDNYQGFYDNAWPILQRYGYPAAMFVHTNYVGDTKGAHPKMSWATLKELEKDKNFTVGSHTVLHFLDLAQKPAEVQKDELEKSKAKLEEKLGHAVDFLAYPNGSNSKETQLLARDAGYKMAFTIVNTPAEESPSLMAVGRYVHTRLDTAIADAERSLDAAPAAVYRRAFDPAPVSFERIEGAAKLSLVRGGKPRSMTSETREGVRDFMQRDGGEAVAGINGGFFSMVTIHSTDNNMVGPLKTREMPAMLPDDARERWGKLRNRPLVLWNEREIAILPYNPETMRDQDQVDYLLPGATDALLAGVWLVHDGQARTREQMNVFGSKDIQDPRRRAAIGIDTNGRFVAAAAAASVSSEAFAQALAEAGLQEAVLLDSGFSTSLVYDGKIKVSGHSEASMPSRPVPHAIVIEGTLDPSTPDDLDIASERPKPEAAKARKRKRRR